MIDILKVRSVLVGRKSSTDWIGDYTSFLLNVQRLLLELGTILDDVLALPGHTFNLFVDGDCGNGKRKGVHRSEL